MKKRPPSRPTPGPASTRGGRGRAHGIAKETLDALPAAPLANDPGICLTVPAVVETGSLGEYVTHVNPAA